jgi:hypothetical protein
MISLVEMMANLQTSGLTIPRNPGELMGVRLAALRKERVKGRLSSTAAKLAGIKGNLGPKEGSLDLRKKQIETSAIKSVSKA